MKLKIVAILAALFLIGTFFMPGGSSVNVKNIYEEAEKAFQEKRYQEAIDKYAQAIQEGKKFGANTKVIDEDFDSLANFKIASAYYQLGKQLGDPTKYEEVLKIVPDIYSKTQKTTVKEGTIFLWGICLYELERYEEAEPKFRELINDYPDSKALENAYYTLGNLYVKLKQYENARESFKTVIVKYPNSNFIASCQYFIGECFFNEGNYDQSYLEFGKVQTDDKTMMSQASYYSGLSLTRMGRNQEALTAYQKFVGDYPLSPFLTAAYFDMGMIHSKLREYDEATRNYDLAIQNAKDDITRGQIQFEIGNNYYAQEDYQAAVNAYRKLMDNYPSDANIPEARYMIGESYWALKDYQNCLQTFTEVLELDPKGVHAAESTYRIGECNYQLGNKELAIEWYDKVISTFPDDPIIKDTIYSKLWALNDLKRYDEAEKIARDYINKYKSDQVYDIAAAEMQMKLADVKLEAENFPAAGEEYLKVVNDYRDLPKFDVFKSRSLRQAGWSYYSYAERNNWDQAFLQKAADAYSLLLNKYWKNFDTKNREFETRVDDATATMINLALTYDEMKQYDKEIEVLNLMPKTHSEYGGAVFLKARTYSKAGRDNEAIALFREIVNDKKLSEKWRAQAAIELATKLRDAGKHSEALAEYIRIADEFPSSENVATSLYYAGSSYYDIEPKTPENMDKAIEMFRRAIEKFPNSETAPWAYIGIMAAYDEKKDYGMVVKTADEMEIKYADVTIPRLNEAKDMARRRKVDAMQKLEEGMTADAMIPELRKIVESPIGDNEGKATAQMRIGMLLFGEKRYSEAIAEFQTLLDKFPGKFTGAAYYQMAASAYWLNDQGNAIDYAQKGLESPDLTQEIKTGLYYTLGLAYSKTNNSAEEIIAMENALQSAEGGTSEQLVQITNSARKELARLYTDNKQYADAEKQYLYLADKYQTPAEKSDVYFWLAKLYEEKLQNYQKAVEAYEKVRELNGSDLLTAQALYFEGVLYSNSIKQNDKPMNDKALPLFTELVSKFATIDDVNVKAMVTDANIRIPGLLLELGKFDDALKTARQALDHAMASGTKDDKINAQYQLANLMGERANKATEGGKANPTYTREAINEFKKVVDLAKPLNQLSPEMKPIVAASLYNAGHLSYTIGQATKDVNEAYNYYDTSADYFEQFVKEFPENENLSAVMQLLSYTTYEKARMKASLADFIKAADYFSTFAKRFPNHKDAAMAQYQAGEAYFVAAGGYSTTEKSPAKAAETYRKAIAAYRAVVDKWPKSEYGADALYGMAGSYALLGQVLNDQKQTDNVNDAYMELAQKYPNSKYAAVAFENVGNNYYNQAVTPGISESQKINLLKQALQSYRKGLQAPNLEKQTKSNLENYIRETEDLLALGPYQEALRLVPTEGTDIATKKANAPRAIQILNGIIRDYPNTDSADLSLVQMGLCYEALEQWDEAMKSYARLIAKYTDSKGNPIVPFSENVVMALKYSKERRTAIMAYQAAQKAGGKR